MTPVAGNATLKRNTIMDRVQTVLGCMRHGRPTILNRYHENTAWAPPPANRRLSTRGVGLSTGVAAVADRAAFGVRDGGRQVSGRVDGVGDRLRACRDLGSAAGHRHTVLIVTTRTRPDAHEA